MKRCLCLIFMLFTFLGLEAEDIRAKVAAKLSLSPESSEGERCNLVYADAAAIYLPEDLSFIEGLELELRVPQSVQAMKGSFIFYIYKKILPLPEEKLVSYSGERVAMIVVPSRVSQVYQIPLGKAVSLKTSPYVSLLAPIERQDFPILFRLMPAIKGLPPALENAVFQLKAKPIYKEEGRVRLALSWAEGLDPESELNLWVDDKEYKGARDSFFLKPGSHSLRISGPSVRDVFKTFSVLSARDQAIEIKLEDVTPKLLLEFPERTKIELDGKPLSPTQAREAIALTPGEHSLVFSVGDYTIQRRLQVQRGKTYRVSLTVDVKVEEED